MTQQAKEPENRITQIVVGTRLDHVPAPETQQVFTRLCVECQLQTGTEIAYPADVALVCNVCAPAVLTKLTQEKNAQLAFDMPAKAKARLIAEAHRRNMPVEQFLNMFLAWRTGRPLNATLFNHPGKDRDDKSKS